MRIAVLLGAGASVDAGLPTSVAMTDAILARIEDSAQRRLLQFVHHTLAAHLAQQPPASAWDLPPPTVSVDIERLFASVELLIDRSNQPWSPFVAAWHSGLESFAQPRGGSTFFARNDLAQALGQIATPGRTDRVAEGIEKFVHQAISAARGGDVTDLLSQTRQAMLRSLFDVLHINAPSKAEYLRPLIDLAREQGTLAIATLNYDRSVENAAEAAGEPCDTGIETWLARGSLAWPDRGLRLLKLHGSIDWVFERVRATGELPIQRIRTVATADEKQRYDAPAVVFGEAGKLRSEGPYLELLLAWSSQLQEADSLLVVGYSFRDPHVNELIARWFNGGPDRRIVVLDPTDPTAAARGTFAEALRWVDPRAYVMTLLV